MSNESDRAFGTDTTEYLTAHAVQDGLAERGVDLDALSVRPDGTHYLDLPDGGHVALGTDDDDDTEPSAWWDYTAYDPDGDAWRTDGGQLPAVLDAIAELWQTCRP